MRVAVASEQCNNTCGERALSESTATMLLLLSESVYGNCDDGRRKRRAAAAAATEAGTTTKMTSFGFNWSRRFVFLVSFTVAIIIAACSIKTATCQQLPSILNSPPIMIVDRNWRLPETLAVGSVVQQVRADDAENNNLEFGLEPLRSGNFGNVNVGDEKMPFRIDPQTGVVYLNESLQGWGGQNFFIYVTVYDGQLTAKNEVYVNILGGNSTKAKDFYNPRPPTFQQHATNISSLFPPFHLLPGVANKPNSGPQQLPPQLRPSEGGSGSDIPKNPNGFTYVTENTQPNSSMGGSANGHGQGSFEAEQQQPGNGKRNKTVLIPVNTRPEYPYNTNKGSVNSGNGLPSNQGNSVDSEETGPLGKFGPVIIVIVVLVLVAAAVVGVVLFRKRLCAISKSLKKKSKAEMAKKSNQSQLSNGSLSLNTLSNSPSTNLTDDSRNSMIMQHWNGPTAFNNRYVPWERDHQQMTSQFSNDSQCSQVTGSGGSGETKERDPWEYPRHRLKFFNILGEGAFGQVWRCEAGEIDGKDGISTVAVKTLKENASEPEKNDLVSELQVMKSLEIHVNVVRLLGCCTDKEPLFVIMEYVNLGKLQTYLRNSRAEKHYGNTHGKSKTLTSGDLTSFMYQVARGMDFLTSRGIIHRDLAARNILITDDHICKVADFGFARDVVTSKVYERKSEGKLPIRWMAPESLYDNIFTVKSDIWSFGILMWEIVTLGSTPYPGIAAAEVMRKVRDGYRLEKPEHCRRELYNIMYYCWAADAAERPTFSELVNLLDKLLHTETDYIELERFPDHNYYNMLSLSGEKL